MLIEKGNTVKKIWRVAIGAALFVVLALGFGYWLSIPKLDGKYDNNNHLVSSKVDFQRVKESVVHIVAQTKYKYDGGKEYIERASVGGIVLAGRYILSVGHGVAEDGDIEIETPEGVFTHPAEVVSRLFFIVDRNKRPAALLTLLYVIHEKDIALYELPPGLILPSFPYEIGDSDELKEGNFVYIIGHPLGSGINIRNGIVSALRWQVGEIPLFNAEKNDFFMLNVGLIPGDSGTPILAIRDGLYELVGITSAAIVPFNQLGFAVRINVVREVIGACIICPEEVKRLFDAPKSKEVRF